MHMALYLKLPGYAIAKGNSRRRWLWWLLPSRHKLKSIVVFLLKYLYEVE